MCTLKIGPLLAGLLLVLPAAAQNTPGRQNQADPQFMAPGPFAVVGSPVIGPRYGEGSDDWSFSYHGYLQEAFAASLGTRPNPAAGQTGTPWHVVNMPIVPDDIWNTWLLTNVQPGPWANMTLS